MTETLTTPLGYLKKELNLSSTEWKNLPEADRKQLLLWASLEMVA